MARTISIGAQSFPFLRENDCFYVDKTDFIRTWWKGADVSTLICRPRRFGKTLMLSTVETFLSTHYANRGEELFDGLAIWNDTQMRALQGTIPIISLSFAGCKGPNFRIQQRRMCEQLAQAWRAHRDELLPLTLSDYEKKLVSGEVDHVDELHAGTSLQRLCDLLYVAHGKNTVVLLDEYDTPMQEAWLGGWWDEAVEFQRALFNNTFKTNQHLERGLITGVTRVSRESIFSDLNNLEIASMRVNKYETSFGFTKDEVEDALAEFDMSDDKQVVEEWYDGFTIGNTSGIYNPWSITKYLSSGELDTYWANTSGNELVSSVIRQGDSQLKEDFETLLSDGTIQKQVDEQVVFSELSTKPGALWGLLVAAGYINALAPVPKLVRSPRELRITNYETRLAFDDMVAQWFQPAGYAYGEFPRALLAGNTKMATRFLTDVCLACMSSFDSGTHPSAQSEPERFYHGLVLGLLVELRGRYAVESNRESGYGRYDVMLVPNRSDDPALILEFKVFDPDDEKTLADTVARALAQIEEKAYVTTLIERGIVRERIRTYGIAFLGKEVLIG